MILSVVQCRFAGGVAISREAGGHSAFKGQRASAFSINGRVDKVSDKVDGGSVVVVRSEKSNSFTCRGVHNRPTYHAFSREGQSWVGAVYS